MRRREFITLIGGAVAGPVPLSAQQPSQMRRIAVLMAYPEGDAESRAWVAAFRDGLQKLGWTEGHNIRIEVRWATANTEAIQRFAKELVALQPELVLSSSTPSTAALLQHTRTIPIIFGIVADPVGSGFTASLARPGGNVTGFTNLEPTMGGKWLELQGDCAARQPCRFPVQPGNGAILRILPEPFQSRRCFVGCRSSRYTCSGHERARNRHCGAVARAP